MNILYTMDELTAKQQLMVAAMAKEEDRHSAIKEFSKENKIKDGSYWTPLEELYEPTKDSYEGGFEKICLRMTEEWIRPRMYEHILNDLKALVESNVKADDISVHSASTKNSDGTSSSVGSNAGSNSNASNSNSNSNNTPRKQKDLVALFKAATPKRLRASPDCLGGPIGNKGHIIPAPKSLCAPRYGIMAQPIIGHSFEDQVNEKIEECRRNNSNRPTSEVEAEVDDLNNILKKVLQKSIISDKEPQGLSNTLENWLYVPKNGHEMHFDLGCQWLFVPVMTLEDALLKWTSGQPYKVMVITGDLREPSPEYSAYLHKTLIHEEILEDETKHMLLTKAEIEMATTFLQDFVKALADMATGRGRGALTPGDLDRTDVASKYDNASWQKKLAELQVGKESLEEGTVLIPKIKVADFSKVKVLGAILENGPDPCNLGIKMGMGFMTQNKQRPLPGCKTHGKDSEGEDSDSDSGGGSEVSFRGGTPSTPEVPREIACVHPVTPSPPRLSLKRLSLSSEDSFGYS